MLLSGPRPFFYTYDLQQGTSTLHRRGLWGTGFDDSTILTSTNNTVRNSKRRRRAEGTTGGGGKGGGGNTDAVLHTAFSPNTGSMLAVAGRGGNVHIVDWKSGAGQVIGSLKCPSSGGGGGGGVQGLWWVPSNGAGDLLGGDSSMANDEKHLGVLTGEAEVYIWDVAQRRCVRKWKDEGGYRGAGRVFTGGGGANGSMAIGSVIHFLFLKDVDLSFSFYLLIIDQQVVLSIFTAPIPSRFLIVQRTKIPSLRPEQRNRSCAKLWVNLRPLYLPLSSTTTARFLLWRVRRRKIQCVWFVHPTFSSFKNNLTKLLLF